MQDEAIGLTEEECSDLEAREAFCQVYNSLEASESAGRLPVAALAARDKTAGPELVSFFRRAGIHEISLWPAARIHAIAADWLNDGVFDREALESVFAEAERVYYRLRPTINRARDLDIVAPDYDNLPPEIVAVRGALDLGEMMIEWDETGRIDDVEWRESLAEDAARYIAPACEYEPRSPMCRTFPYVARRPD